MTMSPKDAARLLRDVYEAKGYIRIKMDKRQGGLRTGWEIRLRASAAREARAWAQAIAALGLEPGKAYARGKGTVLPVYGRKQVEEFLKRVKPRKKANIPAPPNATDLRVAGRKSR